MAYDYSCDLYKIIIIIVQSTNYHIYKAKHLQNIEINNINLKVNATILCASKYSIKDKQIELFCTYYIAANNNNIAGGSHSHLMLCILLLDFPQVMVKQ